MIRSAAGPAAARWGPYALAGTLLLVDYLWLSRSLSLVGTHYGPSALNRGDYNDVLSLSSLHYLRPGHIIHPIPYVDDRIEYPVLLGLTLWLPTWLPGGPATWFAAAGVLTAAATFGSIALLRRHHPASVWWIAASPALLLDGGINWDLIGIFFLVGGVVWLGERRLGLSGASTALGTCFKLFPVVVAPMAVAALGSRWSRARSGRATAPGTDAAGRDVARWVVPFGAVSAQRRYAFSRTLAGLMPHVAGIRRFGAAALDLAWVAAGRFDGYWELGIKPWDVAAGMILVREAGGYATDAGEADPRDTGNIVAGNPHLHAKLRVAVNEGMHPTPAA